MAGTKDYDKGDKLSVIPTDGGVNSGDPLALGGLIGVALTKQRADNTVSAAFRGVFELSVKGIDGVGNSAVAVGDTLYYTAGDTPKISKKATGTKVGTALKAVTSGSTATIPVRLAGSP